MSGSKRGQVLNLPPKEARRQAAIRAEQARQEQAQRQALAQKITVYQERFLATATSLVVGYAQSGGVLDPELAVATARRLCDTAAKALPPGMVWGEGQEPGSETASGR